MARDVRYTCRNRKGFISRKQYRKMSSSQRRKCTIITKRKRAIKSRTKYRGSGRR